MSILHRLKIKEAAFAKVYKLLKPGVVFISSTACLGYTSMVITILSKVSWMVGLTVNAFTSEELQASLVEAGFEIEHVWRPDGEGIKATFIIARKTS